MSNQNGTPSYPNAQIEALAELLGPTFTLATDPDLVVNDWHMCVRSAGPPIVVSYDAVVWVTDGTKTLLHPEKANSIATTISNATYAFELMGGDGCTFLMVVVAWPSVDVVVLAEALAPYLDNKWRDAVITFNGVPTGTVGELFDRIGS